MSNKALFSGHGIRKRLTRWTIYGLPVALLCSCWLWYSYTFPLPRWGPGKGDPFSIGFFQPLAPHQDRLVNWKIRWKTESLKLEGSVWQDRDTGAIVEFGEDGVFRWRKEPNPALFTTGYDPFTASVWSDAGFLDGKAYEFHQDKSSLRWNPTQRSSSWSSSNLSFPNENFDGFMGYNGRVLMLRVESMGPSIPRSFELSFDRRLRR